MKVWLDGELIEETDPRLPLFNHRVGMADGSYETFRLHCTDINDMERWKDWISPHLERLKSACVTLCLRYDIDRDRFFGACSETLAANDLFNRDARMRIILLRRAASTERDQPDPVSLGVFAYPIHQDELDMRREVGVRVTLLPPTRIAGDPLYQVKHLGNAQSMMARLKLNSVDADDALVRNDRLEICEGVFSNVFFVKDRLLVTPPIPSPCLPGVTRSRVMQLGRDQGFETFEKAVSESDLLAADEVFLTSGISEVMPVIRIDHHTIGNGVPGRTAQLMQRLLVDLRK